MNFFVYILFSDKLDRYYVGATKEIATRLKEHLWDHGGFTSKAKDWVVCYSEGFLTKAGALTREKEIKKWKSRIMIEKLIASKN